MTKRRIVRKQPKHIAPSDTASRPQPAGYEAIADLIGSVERGPSDLSARKKHYLKVMGYGRKPHKKP